MKASHHYNTDTTCCVITSTGTKALHIGECV